jgi:hypothetical protein
MTQNKSPRIRNLTITGITALTGCISLVVVAVALLLGLWIDSLLGRRGPATVCLLVASAPVGLYLMVRTALTLVKYIEPPTPVRKRNKAANFYEEKEE